MCIGNLNNMIECHEICNSNNMIECHVTYPPISPSPALPPKQRHHLCITNNWKNPKITM